jgi:hypothetical protein
MDRINQKNTATTNRSKTIFPKARTNRIWTCRIAIRKGIPNVKGHTDWKEIIQIVFKICQAWK